MKVNRMLDWLDQPNEPIIYFQKMANSPPDIQQEIAVLDKVLTKLALTSEADLAGVLERFLGGVLEKLESPHEQTRNKVSFPLAFI
jgi:hypothetical protein